jgi:hypothetical protein
LDNLLEQSDSGIGDQHTALSSFEHKFDDESLSRESEYEYGYCDERRDAQVADEKTKGEKDHERGDPNLMKETEGKVEPSCIRGEHCRDLAWAVGNSCPPRKSHRFPEDLANDS